MSTMAAKSPAIDTLVATTARYRRHNDRVAQSQTERTHSPEQDLWALRVAKRMGVRARNPIARAS